MLTEAGVYAVGAILLSMPIAVLISIYLNDRMGAAWIQIQDDFPPLAFVEVLVPALVLIPLGCYPGIRHVVSRADAGLDPLPCPRVTRPVRSWA